MKKQSKLKKQWQDKGYFVVNLIRVTPIGLPDFICLKPNHVCFVESKEVWDRLSPLQRVWLSKLSKMGFECYVNDQLYVTDR